MSVITTCADESNFFFCAYDIKGKENISSTSETNKRHVVVMFTSMNVSNTYYIQGINACLQHRGKPSVR